MPGNIDDVGKASEEIQRRMAALVAFGKNGLEERISTIGISIGVDSKLHARDVLTRLFQRTEGDPSKVTDEMIKETFEDK